MCWKASSASLEAADSMNDPRVSTASVPALSWGPLCKEQREEDEANEASFKEEKNSVREKKSRPPWLSVPQMSHFNPFIEVSEILTC